MILHIGSRGAQVTAAQNLLIKAGYDLKADGIFGPETLTDTKAFQKSNGLVDDGFIGDLTAAKLGLVPGNPAPGEWDGSFVMGLDVSRYQRKMTRADWIAEYLNGVRFQYAKGLDGLNSDSTLEQFKADAEAAGILNFAGYVFNRFAIDPKEQGVALVKRTGGVKSGELPHVVDDEWDNSPASAARYGDGHEMDVVAEEHIYTLLSTVEEESGVTPFHYTSNGFFVARNPARFERFPLILANYSSQGDDKVPCPAPYKREVIRQYSGSLSLPSTGGIDGDRFLGTLDQLKAYRKA